MDAGVLLFLAHYYRSVEEFEAAEHYCNKLLDIGGPVCALCLCVMSHSVPSFLFPCVSALCDVPLYALLPVSMCVRSLFVCSPLCCKAA